jgi:hypothetical protein
MRHAFARETLRPILLALAAAWPTALRRVR